MNCKTVLWTRPVPLGKDTLLIAGNCKATRVCNLKLRGGSVSYQVSQQVLDRNLAKNLKKKLVIYILSKQYRSHFNLTRIFLTKISRIFEIFTKTSHLKPCMRLTVLVLLFLTAWRSQGQGTLHVDQVKSFDRGCS